MNAWYYAKGGPTTLGYLNRDDIPYHYALADAYTIGDAYHCSVLSATGPNRTYLWSGTINADQQHGTFVAYSGGDELGKFLSWPSYPETLLALKLANGGTQTVTFTVTANHSKEPARAYHVPPGGSAAHVAAPLSSSDGWYDLSVTISGDASWSRRYAGHLEDSQPSITG